MLAPRRPGRRVVLLTTPLAALAVLLGGAAAVEQSTASSGPATLRHVRASASSAQLTASAFAGGARSVSISRSLDRRDLVVRGHRWTTASLNVYPRPRQHARRVAELPTATKVAVTGRHRRGFTEIVLHRRARWVHSGYLAVHKPAPVVTDPARMDLVFTPCAATASVERGLVPGAIRVWEAVCHAFPQVTTYGGYAPRGEHASGKAIDVMIDGDAALGTAVAQFLQAHAAELDLYDIIYRQHIWTPVRASEGWRLMPDRGSPTANHMDHVHVAVN